MQITLLRNATIVVQVANQTILVDPMLGAKNSYDPVPWTSNGIRNPMVDLPISPDELNDLIKQTTAVLITHTHNDHWDPAAAVLIPKEKLILCQPEDEAKLKGQGFTNVASIANHFQLQQINIIRTKGRHGHGEIGERMAPVSGYVLKVQNHVVYLAGDTVWCDEVKEVITTYQPDIILLNAGGAKFDMGDPIIMDAKDVLEVAKHSPDSTILCIHMEAINHCYLKRDELAAKWKASGLTNPFFVPANGERINL